MPIDLVIDERDGSTKPPSELGSGGHSNHGNGDPRSIDSTSHNTDDGTSTPDVVRFFYFYLLCLPVCLSVVRELGLSVCQCFLKFLLI